MDIYIVRKCKVEMRDFSGASGTKYKLPVMTAQDIHSYVFQGNLTSEQRDKIQKDLEDYYTKAEQKGDQK